MSVVVFAAPYVPPLPPVNPFPGMSMLWTGSSGDAWDLNDPGSGVMLVGDSVEGMHLPEFADYVQEFAGLDGQDYDGGVAKARNVEWTVFVWSDNDSVEWVERERAWWSSFKPRGSRGTWSVALPTGERRTLRCRLTSDGGYAHINDPSRFGWAAYPITLIADDPWWYGEPITDSWGAPDTRLFFGGGDPDTDTGTPAEVGPPFFVSTSASFEEATATNVGDEPTWPKWTIKGPVTAATITVDGGSIGVPAVAAGHTLVINTDPADPTAFDGSTDKSGLIDPWDPRPIPPGETVPITIGIEYTAGASVSLFAPTRYWRAFG